MPPVEILPGLSIYPRDAWGATLPPKGPIEVETPQFLLVHHTASSNSYASAASLIQATYSFHTSSAKGWNDVCYEFFIGRDGDVWEGRAGALTGPVVADATGGSQGFAQLICLLGDFTTQLPTAAAQASLVNVLAWLAGRYDDRHQPRCHDVVHIQGLSALADRNTGDDLDHRRPPRHVVHGLPR